MPVTVTKLNNKKNQEEFKNVLILICAWLNNICSTPLDFTYCLKNITSEVFDLYYRKIEQKMKLCFSPAISGYICMKRNDNKITLSKRKKFQLLCSVNTHLYFPSVSSIEQVWSQDAMDILNKCGPPTQLKKFEERTYHMFESLQDLRNENDNLQFKAINRNDVPIKLAEICLAYIAAFCNLEGGLILFGIDDDDGKVVGVTVADQKYIGKYGFTAVHILVNCMWCLTVSYKVKGIIDKFKKMRCNNKRISYLTQLGSN